MNRDAQGGEMQPTQVPPPKGFRRPRNIVVIVAAIVVVIAFVAVEFRFTTVDITVISNHTTSTVSFSFAFDGQQTGSGILAPGQKTQYSIPLSWWFYSCEPHSFSATSTGGESGPVAASGNLTVCAGTSYATALSV